MSEDDDDILPRARAFEERVMLAPSSPNEVLARSMVLAIEAEGANPDRLTPEEILALVRKHGLPIPAEAKLVNATVGLDYIMLARTFKEDR